jgi:hypothetical protein
MEPQRGGRERCINRESLTGIILVPPPGSYSYSAFSTYNIILYDPQVSTLNNRH